jgi:hypothetical protein
VQLSKAWEGVSEVVVVVKVSRSDGDQRRDTVEFCNTSLFRIARLAITTAKVRGVRVLATVSSDLRQDRGRGGCDRDAMSHYSPLSPLVRIQSLYYAMARPFPPLARAIDSPPSWSRLGPVTMLAFKLR